MVFSIQYGKWYIIYNMVFGMWYDCEWGGGLEVGERKSQCGGSGDGRRAFALGMFGGGDDWVRNAF